MIFNLFYSQEIWINLYNIYAYLRRISHIFSLLSSMTYDRESHNHTRTLSITRAAAQMFVLKYSVLRSGHWPVGAGPIFLHLLMLQLFWFPQMNNIIIYFP